MNKAATSQGFTASFKWGSEYRIKQITIEAAFWINEFASARNDPCKRNCKSHPMYMMNSLGQRAQEYLNGDGEFRVEYCTQQNALLIILTRLIHRDLGWFGVGQQQMERFPQRQFFYCLWSKNYKSLFLLASFVTLVVFFWQTVKKPTHCRIPFPFWLSPHFCFALLCSRVQESCSRALPRREKMTHQDKWPSA